MRTLALEHITVLGLSPPEIISVAHEAGFDAASICLTPSPILLDKIQPLTGDTELVRETARRVEETGIGLSLGEGFAIDRETTVGELQEPLEIAAELGARCINCTILESDRGHATALLAELTERAADLGLETAIEFSAFSPLASSLEASRELIEEVANPHFGILVDIMHVIRCGDSLGALASLPSGIIKYAQVCDGLIHSPSREAYMDEAIFDRRLPGEGEFGVAEFLKLIPFDVVVGVETPSRTLERQGFTALERARQSAKATRALLNGEKP